MNKLPVRGQGGFTLIEVLVVCTILGVLASIAVPKFTNSVAMANTAKIQADLEAIDTAAALYEMETGAAPASVAALADYIKDAASLKPPTGKCRLKDGTVENINATEYTLQTVSGSTEVRAYCGNWTSASFGKQ
ncbi:MAG: prepilin-type N-terminal cleavage/methylation domain-containing protein [Selenomonadaceae bacterium]|nr:prepilin-type N-terminal cleavage/methylation domain-containing protein [Selenomonadaceae bacterium]